MRSPRRRSPAIGDAFTFGGRIPAGLGLLLAAILAATVASWLARNDGWAALVPALVVRGEVWRLVSWAFVQRDPLTLLFGGFMLYTLGQQLGFLWSERRLVVAYLGLAAGATLLTVLVAIFWAPANQPHLGLWPVVNAFLLVWALQYPDRQMSIWGVLPVTGKTLALLVVFGTLLYGLAGGGLVGIGAFVPHFAALAIAYGLSRGISTRRLRLRARDWWNERAFRRRAKHLKVVQKDGQGGPPRWMN